jgi:hypothetical protein
MGDFKDFKESFPSSMRTFLDMMKTAQSCRWIETPVDLEDPSLRCHRTRKPILFIPPDLSEKFDSLTPKEKRSILLGLACSRESEVATNKTSDIYLDSAMAGMDIVGKGEKKRFVEFRFFPLLEENLRQTMDFSNIFTVGKTEHAGYTRGGAGKMMRKAAEKIGSSPSNPQFLRHLGVTVLLLLGVSLRDVKGVTGHAHEKTPVQEYFFGQAYLALKVLENSQTYTRLFGSPWQPMIKEASQVLRIGIREMQYLCKRGKIKALKIKGKWFIEASDLMDYRQRSEKRRK